MFSLENMSTNTLYYIFSVKKSINNNNINYITINEI